MSEDTLLSKIKKKWEDLEKNKKSTVEVNEVREIEYKDFSEIFKISNFKKLEQLMEDFYSGNIFAVKNSFSKEFLNKVKLYLLNNFSDNESTFFKTKEGCPNFHRIIGKKEAKKYVLNSNRKDYYFFPWNRQKDKMDLFQYFYPKWRLVKLLSGVKFDEYEKNTPKDGVIDRLLFRVYSNNTGFLEAHIDPPTLRIVSGIHMSKKGKDFDDGGIYFFKNNKHFDVENYFDAGDMALFTGSLKHGVKKITSEENKKKDGARWWICLSNPVSDEVKNRTIQKPVY